MVPFLTIQMLSSVSYRISLILYILALVSPINGMWFAGIVLFIGTLIGSTWTLTQPEFRGLLTFEMFLPFYNIIYFIAAFRFRETIFAERLSLLDWCIIVCTLHSVFLLSSLFYGAGDSLGLFVEKLPFVLWVQSLCFLVAARLLFRLSKLVKLKEQVRKTHD